jgi:hypothetical protein
MEYQKALEAQDISTRIISNQSGVEDFCFLKHATQLVGLSESTFAFWAGYLGNNATTQRSVTLYTVESPQRKRHFRKKLGTNLVHWTHPALKDRFHYETYDSSRNDAIAAAAAAVTTTKASEEAEEGDEELA